MTHYCPDCKSTHNIWYHIEGIVWYCGKCEYILNPKKMKKSLIGWIAPCLWQYFTFENPSLKGRLSTPVILKDKAGEFTTKVHITIEKI